MARVLLSVLIAAASLAIPPRAITGQVFGYVVAEGDTLLSIGARFGVDANWLARDNHLRSNSRLSPGTFLTVDNRHIAPAAPPVHGVIVNVPQRMLFVFDGKGGVRAFPVAVGLPNWRTPLGRFTVTVKEIDPTWDVPPSIQRELAEKQLPVLTQVPPGPANPLGNRWLGLSAHNVGIHGTNSPASIFRSTTHGCIRMHPDDILALFELVAVGTPVDIVYEPVMLATGEQGTTFLEVHRDVYRATGSLSARVDALLRQSGLPALVGTAAVRSVVSEQAGRAVAIEEGDGLESR